MTSEERNRNLVRQLAAMRLTATLVLALMAAIYVLCSLLGGGSGVIGYVRAFAEAAMIGGVADWFAVTALFRRPFGLPIPHTAIIPRSQKRIARGVGDFVALNFFDRKAILAKLKETDPVRRAALWAAQEENARKIGHMLAQRIPAAMDAFGEEPIKRLLRDLALRRLSRLDAGRLSATVLRLLAKSGYYLALLDFLLNQAAQFVHENQGVIRRATREKSKWWVPRWADHKLADEIAAGLEQTFSDMRHPDHPWRSRIDQGLEDFIGRLETDPALRGRAEAMKRVVMSKPEVADMLTGIAARLGQDLRRSASDGRLEKALTGMVMDLARRVLEDERLKKTLDVQLRRLASGIILPSAQNVGGFVANIIEKWNTPTLVQKIELNLGRDLQYIRINGALVGGLAGLALHAANESGVFQSDMAAKLFGG